MVNFRYCVERSKGQCNMLCAGELKGPTSSWCGQLSCWRLAPVVPVVEGQSEAEFGRGGFLWNSLYCGEYIQA